MRTGDKQLPAHINFPGARHAWPGRHARSSEQAASARGTRWTSASASRLLSFVDCSGKCFVRYSEMIILGVDTRSSSWLPLSSRLLMLLDCARAQGARPS